MENRNLFGTRSSFNLNQTAQKTRTDPVKIALDKLVNDYMRHGQEGWLKFMRDELKYQPDDLIEQALFSLSGYHDTTVVSSHGVGKTTAGACTLLTAMAMVPNLVTLQLSPTWTQVTEVFWNEVRKWYQNSKLLPVMFDMADKAPKMWSRFAPETWYARGVSSSKQGNVEGRHNQNIFLIVDEAKAVHDNIIEGIQGALTSAGENAKVWRAYFSTPSTPVAGYSLFYKSHTKHSARWNRFKIPAHMSPRVSERWVNQMIDDWGAESQIVRARVFAEFPDASDETLLSLQAAEHFYQDDLVSNGHVTVACDVARFGKDESVITVYKGSNLVAILPFEKKDTSIMAMKVFEIHKQYDSRVIVIDDIGVGGGVTDQVRMLVEAEPYVTVIPFIGSRKADEQKKFNNLGSECFYNFARSIKTDKTKSAIQDEVLEGQLTSFKVKYVRGLICIEWPERKGDRMGSDSRSPDRAYSAMMAWYGSTILNQITISRQEEQKAALDPDSDAKAKTVLGNMLKRPF